MPRSDSNLAAVTALPLELLQKICSYLCCHCLRTHATVDCDDSQPELRDGTREGREALLNLTQACRVLNAAAEPFLYHCLHTSGKHALYSLIRTLGERPDLRSRVSAIDVGPARGTPPRSLPQPTLDAVLSHMRHAGLLRLYDARKSKDDPEISPTMTEGAEHGTLVSSLLHLLPNVESFHLRLADNGSFRMPPESRFWRPWLKSLRRLAFSSAETPLMLNQVALIIRLAPGVEVLHLSGVACVTHIFPAFLNQRTPDNPPPLANLAELSLSDALLTASSLGNVLEAVGPRLSKFSIRRRRPPLGLYGVPDCASFDAASTELRRWSHTLKELSLDLKGGAHSQPPCRLREFRALEVLHINPVAFDFNGNMSRTENALWSKLPNSIRELRLLEYNDRAVALRGLVNAYTAGVFPGLRKVEIHDKVFEEYEPESEAAQELRELGASFRAAGIEFILRPEPRKADSEE